MRKFSYFGMGVRNSVTPICERSVKEMFEEIKSFANQSYTEELRGKEGSEKAEYKASHFASCTFSGSFSKRAKAGLYAHSGLMCLDFDKLGVDPEAFKARVSEDKGVTTYLLFTSPSGNGVKIVLPIDLEIATHEQWFEAFKMYFSKVHGAAVDDSGKDVTRLCFIPHDPKAIYKGEEAEQALSVRLWLQDGKMFAERTEAAPTPSQKPTASRESEKARADVETLIERCRERGVALMGRTDGTGRYHRWLNIGFALADAFGESGRGYFKEITEIGGYRHIKSADEQYNDCLKHEGSGVTLSTIFQYAKGYGIIVAPTTPTAAEDFEGFDKEPGKADNATLATLKRIERLLKMGKEPEAWRLMKDTLEAHEEGSEDEEAEFAEDIKPLTPSDIEAALAKIKEGIPTGFEVMKHRGGTGEPIRFNAGLSFICAPTGHGKTSFLNMVAIHEAFRNRTLKNGKRVLYFSYEVDKSKLMLGLINAFNNDPELSKIDKPLNAITDYFTHSHSSRYFREDTYLKDGSKITHFEHFKRSKSEMFDYLCADMDIVNKGYKLKKLLRAIKHYINASKHEYSMIIIDYAQLIYKEETSRSRTEEVKDIVNAIKDYANEAGLPFVMAAQFSREVNTPLDIDINVIGESKDLGMIADMAVGLFNLSRLKTRRGSGDEKADMQRLFEDLTGKRDLWKQYKTITNKKGEKETKEYIELTKLPVIYAKILKNRDGESDVEGVFRWEGRTKSIYPNALDRLFTDTEKEQLGITPGKDAPKPPTEKPFADDLLADDDLPI